MRTETRLGLVTLVVIGVAAACGGRAGTEIFGYDGVATDAGLEGGGTGGGIMEGGPGGTGGSVVPDASADVSEDVSADVSEDVSQEVGLDAPDDKLDFFDNVIFSCPDCLQNQCGTDINNCYNDPTCWQGIQCVVTDCLIGGGGGGNGGSGGGGQIDYMCLLGCFDNDLGSALGAIDMFTCITQSCGDACGLGGLAGAGGGGNAAWVGFGGEELFGSRNSLSRTQRYVGSVRIPAPEEVACCYPWLVDVLSGRRPDPLPPSAKGSK